MVLAKIFTYTFYAIVIICGCAEVTVSAPNTSTTKIPQSEAFNTLLNNPDPSAIEFASKKISREWQTDYVPMMIETARYATSPYASKAVLNVLSKKTKQDFGNNLSAWYEWLWNQPEDNPQGYDNFKANIYRNIDPRFERYFQNRQSSARIRLDEIRWGGVLQDGIPPLRDPNMIRAKQATYLDDDNIVFGIEINGDARAYPKRILAWHEMFVDEVGGVDIVGVYCTLCGTVIPYKTEFKGVKHQLGTSGFLYRSNKLMYDQATQSLWNTIKGEPVLGPLVDQGIVLEHLSVVTTTWGEWKRRHPDTEVLSLKTGHQRDYGEGVAYKNYFSTDRLMFNTPFRDKRLKNKQEILALRFPASPTEQLAIDTKFLSKNPLYLDKVGQQKLLVLTDSSGANRVYNPENVNFVAYDRDRTITDAEGTTWHLTEAKLESSDGRILERLPYHRAFWFGWYSAYPDTRLVM